MGELTDREFEVVSAIAGGETRPEIAKRLRISVRTVESHMQNAGGKVGDGRGTLNNQLTRWFFMRLSPSRAG